MKMQETKVPKNWEIKKLGEVCEVINGKNQKKVLSPTGKYPIYGSSGIIGFATDFLCNEGTTIIGRKGTINSPIFVQTKFWNVDTAFGLSPIKHIENKFLFFFCVLFDFTSLDKSTTIPSLAKRDILEIEIPIPPLSEQQAIVQKIEELFSELDKSIENLKIAQQQIKTFRQSVLKSAFEGKLTSKKEVENVMMVAEPNLEYGDNKLPEGWKREKLGNISTVTSSRRIFKDDYVGSGIPFYRTKEIKELSENKEVSLELFISPSKYEEIKLVNDVPKVGDLLISAVGTIGVSYIVKDDTPFYFKDGNLIWIKNLESISSKYLNFIFQHFIRYRQNVETSGSAYNALTIVKLKEFIIPLPDIEEQDKIVAEIESRFSVADKLEESINQSLLQAETLRQSILKKAFEGKLI